MDCRITGRPRGPVLLALQPVSSPTPLSPVALLKPAARGPFRTEMRCHCHSSAPAATWCRKTLCPPSIPQSPDGLSSWPSALTARHPPSPSDSSHRTFAPAVPSSSPLLSAWLTLSPPCKSQLPGEAAPTLFCSGTPAATRTPDLAAPYCFSFLNSVYHLPIYFIVYLFIMSIFVSPYQNIRFLRARIFVLFTGISQKPEIMPCT